MKITLKPRVFLIGFLPGFLFIFGFIFIYKNYEFDAFNNFVKNITLFSGIAIIILSFIIGQVIDSFRDSAIENFLDIFCSKIRWKFFYEKSETDIDKLDNNFYLFYVLNLNLSICLLLLLVMIITGWPEKFPTDFQLNKSTIIIITIASIIVLFIDAIILRKYISKITS